MNAKKLAVCVVLFGLGLCLGACAGAGYGGRRVAPPAGDAQGHLATGRAYLLSGEDEPAGFGLYSYMLLPEQEDPAAPGRLIELLKLHLTQLSPAAELEESIPRSSLNVTLLPLKREPPTSVRTAGAGSSEAHREMAASWLLEHYDHERARSLLALVSESAARGPVLVSHRQALSHQVAPEGFLIQDMSEANPSLMQTWLYAFQARVHRPGAWADERVATLAGELRAVLTQAGKVPHAQLDGMIRLVWRGRSSVWRRRAPERFTVAVKRRDSARSR